MSDSTCWNRLIGLNQFSIYHRAGRYSFIPKVSIEYDENKIIEINQCLTEKSDHAMPSEEASG